MSGHDITVEVGGEIDTDGTLDIDGTFEADIGVSLSPEMTQRIIQRAAPAFLDGFLGGIENEADATIEVD